MTLASKLAEERRARLAAERLLELKQAELFAANRKLGKHAEKLSNEIVETRAEVVSESDLPTRLGAFDPRTLVLLDEHTTPEPGGQVADRDWPLQPARVVAYEQEGQGGTRFIVTDLGRVQEVDEARFAELVPNPK